jgi:hypothetical protein
MACLVLVAADFELRPWSLLRFVVSRRLWHGLSPTASEKKDRKDKNQLLVHGLNLR